MDKHKTLTAEHARREEEIAGYQLNIDLYMAALQDISGRSEHERAMLQVYTADIENRIKAERLEQLKSTVMLAAVQQQLANTPVTQEALDESQP